MSLICFTRIGISGHTMPVRSRQCKRSRKQLWDGKTYDLKTAGYGVSGLVLLLDDCTVIKIPLGSPRSINDINTERKAYSRLAKNSSPYITKCYDYEDPRGIILERLDKTVRSRLRRGDSTPTQADVLKWAMQAARGLAFLHRRGIVQADVGCHNMLLDSKENLKLCDFSGCSIDERDASVCYEPWSQSPSVDIPNEQSDIFALGSAIYEMSVGHVPHHDVPDFEISALYEACKFPDDYPVDRDQLLWDIIKGCWNGEYTTADEVVAKIKHISPHIGCAQTLRRSVIWSTRNIAKPLNVCLLMARQRSRGTGG
jgi:serine/threonine protein kinase